MDETSISKNETVAQYPNFADIDSINKCNNLPESVFLVVGTLWDAVINANGEQTRC